MGRLRKISFICIEERDDAPTRASVRADHLPDGRQTGNYPETLVLYRTRPIPRRQVGSGGRAGRGRYSCLKEAAGEEALMQIQWCGRGEKDSGNRTWR